MSYNGNDNDKCSCGRAQEKPHCPNCGSSRAYGFSKPIQRVHPRTGEMINNVIVYRCQSCARRYDDLQWRFECHAPKDKFMKHAEFKEQAKESLMALADSGHKFNENERRHFQKIVGLSVYEYKEMMKHAMAAKEKAYGIKKETIVNPQKLEPVTIPGLGTIKFSTATVSKTPVGAQISNVMSKDTKLTPFENHLLTCTHCQMCDKGMECEIGKALIENPDPFKGE